MGWEEQGLIFAVCSLCGALVGIGADGYRAWQSAVRSHRSIVTALDCLFWCVLAALVCALMLVMNGGDMRLYVFLALALGYLVYRHLVGTRIVRLWLWFARAVMNVCRCLRRVIITLCLPLAWCLRIVMRLARRIRRWLNKLRKSPPDEKS